MAKNKYVCYKKFKIKGTHYYELVLTDYGRERSKICAGGWNGCRGKIFKKTKSNETLCKKCWKIYKEKYE